MHRNTSFVRRAIAVTVGVLVLALGLHLFLIPGNLAVGGTTGLAMVMNHYFPHIPVGLIVAILNLILFGIAFLLIGREFGGFTIYASLVLSGFLMALEKLIPLTGPVVDDLFLNLIFGILLAGVGMGIVFNQNASTGGTDIIAKIINVFFHIDIGKSLMVADFAITIFAGLTFGPKIGLYALLGVMINSVIIDEIIAGITKKVSIMIISDEREKINDYLQKDIDRGSTILQGIGGYTGDERPVLFTVLSKTEFVLLRSYVRKIDPNAFMIINYIHEVEGEGFTR